MNRGWRIGRIGGIEIRMDPSLLFIAALLTFQFWAELTDQARRYGRSEGTVFAYSALGVVLFFGSILGHELAHAGVCRLRRIPVAGITLWMFGGATHARIESRGPGDEFLVTAAGPATSLALGGLFLWGYFGVRGSPGDPTAYLLLSLGATNVLLGAFNLIPGFPLDGGRLLRSALWKLTGSLSRATRMAARVGQVFAAAFIVFGVWVFVRTERFDALWLAFIGWFLFRAATGAAAEGDRRRLLESATVGQVMSPPPPTIHGSLPVEEVLHRYLVGHEGEAFPVIEADRLIGYVSLGTIQGVPLDRPVREAMADPQGTVEVRPQDRLVDVAYQLDVSPTRTALVFHDGRLVGVLEPEDLNRYLRVGRGTSGREGGSSGTGHTPQRPDVQPR